MDKWQPIDVLIVGGGLIYAAAILIVGGILLGVAIKGRRARQRKNRVES